jgi:hypothetical protein
MVALKAPRSFGMPIPTAVFYRSMKTVPRPEWNVKTLLQMGEKAENCEKRTRGLVRGGWVGYGKRSFF